MQHSLAAAGAQTAQPLDIEAAGHLAIVVDKDGSGVHVRIPAVSAEGTRRLTWASVEPTGGSIVWGEDGARFAGLGVTQTLTKPTKAQVLFDAVSALFERPAASTVPAPVAAAPAPAATAPRLAQELPLRVLLAEDNEVNQRVASLILGGLGYDIRVVVNGLQALDAVDAAAQAGEPFDVVLMDVQMPEMDGLEATRRIRALARRAGGERFRTLPIIAMTALAMARDEQQSLAAGMNDHITKPVSPERLQDALARWLRIPVSSTTPDEQQDTLPDDLRALDSLDTTRAVHRIGGDAEAYRKQLRRFRTRYADAPDRLAGLLAEGALRAAEEYCHALKGVCGNIGADALFACIATIDAQLKQMNAPGAESVVEMRRLLSRVMDDIDLLEAPSRVVHAAGAALSDPEIAAHVTRLMTQLETDLGAAQATLAELRSGMSESPLETQVRDVAEKIDLFEIEDRKSVV